MLTLPCAFALGWWWVQPPKNLRYEFEYSAGGSSSWHAVQVHHLEKGQWIGGPWIGAWPLQIRFPDLNGDGHADIEVTSRGHVTFLYLPNNDGKRFWALQVKEGQYAVSYPPAGLIYP